MTKVCPKDPTHEEFETTAHVMQSWKVNREGDFLDELKSCIQVTHPPHPDNEWVCMTCGEPAIEAKE